MSSISLDPTRFFYDHCPHQLDGFQWKLVPPPIRSNWNDNNINNNNNHKKDRILVSTYDITQPSVFMTNIAILHTIEKTYENIIMDISTDGLYVTYIKDEEIIVKKSLKSCRILESNENLLEFTVYYKNDARPYTHTLHIDSKDDRNLFVNIIEIASHIGFSHFDVQMVRIHHSLCKESISTFTPWVNRFMRLMNGRLLIYRNQETQFPLYVFDVHHIKLLKKRSQQLKIIHADQVYTFKFDTAFDRSVWIQAIVAAKFRGDIESQEIRGQKFKMNILHNKSIRNDNIEQTKFTGFGRSMPNIKTGRSNNNENIPSGRMNRSVSEPGDDNQYEQDRLFEVHTMTNGIDNMIQTKYRHWPQMFIYSMEAVKAEIDHVTGTTIIHLNIGKRTMQYFANEKLTLERNLINAVVTPEPSAQDRLTIRYEGDDMPIVHCLLDAHERPEMLQILYILTSPKYHKLNLPNVCIHKGACDKRSRTTLFWNQRYIILVNGRLLIYRDAASQCPLYVASLLRATIAASGINRILVKTIKHNWTFRFSNQEERDKWFKAIHLSLSRGREERTAIARQSGQYSFEHRRRSFDIAAALEMSEQVDRSSSYIPQNISPKNAALLNVTMESESISTLTSLSELDDNDKNIPSVSSVSSVTFTSESTTITPIVLPKKTIIRHHNNNLGVKKWEKVKAKVITHTHVKVNTPRRNNSPPKKRQSFANTAKLVHMMKNVKPRVDTGLRSGRSRNSITNGRKRSSSADNKHGKIKNNRNKKRNSRSAPNSARQHHLPPREMKISPQKENHTPSPPKSKKKQKKKNNKKKKRPSKVEVTKNNNLIVEISDSDSETVTPVREWASNNGLRRQATPEMYKPDVSTVDLNMSTPNLIQKQFKMPKAPSPFTSPTNSQSNLKVGDYMNAVISLYGNEALRQPPLYTSPLSSPRRRNSDSLLSSPTNSQRRNSVDDLALFAGTQSSQRSSVLLGQRLSLISDDSIIPSPTQRKQNKSSFNFQRPTPGEVVELRVDLASDDGSIQPLGFVDIHPNSPLNALRLTILNELDDIPPHFRFLKQENEVENDIENRYRLDWLKPSHETYIIIKPTALA